MIEVFGDLWEIEPDLPRCITTNGYVTQEGCAVMGRGCAAEARCRFPGVDHHLGQLIAAYGNHVHDIGSGDGRYQGLISFPVKHHWREQADLRLIYRSAQELLMLLDEEDEHVIAPADRRVLLPRPGCGNGRLRWADVCEVIAILDDRVLVVGRPEEAP